MKKSELISKIAEKTGYEKDAVENFLNAFVNEIEQCLAKGEKVSIHGFGKFFSREYGERACYNPVTKELITLSPSVQPVFSAGPKLRQKLNSK